MVRSVGLASLEFMIRFIGALWRFINLFLNGWLNSHDLKLGDQIQHLDKNTFHVRAGDLRDPITGRFHAGVFFARSCIGKGLPRYVRPRLHRAAR